VDLMPIVRENLYHREFRGSFSLKKVLPALVPTLTYDDLEIAEGETASAYLMTLLFGQATKSAEDRAKLERDLLAYCERDTLAMIELTRRLEELAQG
jgi:hypothetical protein